MNLSQIEMALKAQKKTWTTSTLMWADFSNYFEIGMLRYAESVEFDFLTENDVTDDAEISTEIMGQALEMRADYLLDTLIALDLK